MAEEKLSLIISNLSQTNYSLICAILEKAGFHKDPDWICSFVKMEIPETEKMTQTEFTLFLANQCQQHLDPLKNTLDKKFGVRVKFGIQIDVDDPDGNLKFLEEQRDDIPSSHRCDACNEPMSEHQAICLNCGMMRS